MRRLFTSLFSFSNIFTKRKLLVTGLTLATGLHFINQYQLKSYCIFNSSLSMVDIISKPIKITDKRSNNQVELIAYQISPTILAVVYPNGSKTTEELVTQNINNLKINQVDTNIKKVIGKYDNILIVQVTKSLPQSGILQHVQQPSLYDQVEVIDLTEIYPRFKQAHVVGMLSSTYIIDIDTCKPGSLVLRNKNPVGIVTSIPRGQFSTLVPFSRLQAIQNRISKNKFNPHLGISVKDSESESKGAFVVRINTTSPFAQHLKLGDTITQINKRKIQKSLDIVDLINSSDDKNVEIVVLRQESYITFKIPNL